MFFLKVFSDDVRLTLTTTCTVRARLLFARPCVFRTDSEAGSVSPRSVPLVARFRSHNYALFTLFSFPNRLVSRKQLPNSLRVVKRADSLRHQRLSLRGVQYSLDSWRRSEPQASWVRSRVEWHLMNAWPNPACRFNGGGRQLGEPG